uniref:Uncharacterized protein n=1 Tax=Anguilla anguilla TaxID=7936 RepID=A0A0E9SBC1_ANGAN
MVKNAFAFLLRPKIVLVLI